MSSTVHIYNKKTGDARLIYRATLSDFLATDEWTTSKPKDAKPAPELKKSLLPTAGREQNRPRSEEVKAELQVQAVAREEAEKVEPESVTKKAPRRRKPVESEDATPSSVEEESES